MARSCIEARDNMSTSSQKRAVAETSLALIGSGQKIKRKKTSEKAPRLRSETCQEVGVQDVTIKIDAAPKFAFTYLQYLGSVLAR